MSNLVVAPLFIPLFTGIVLVFIPGRLQLQKWLAGAGTLLTLASSVSLISHVSQQGIQVLHLGNWEAPFGISLVADMLSSLLVATSSVVALACVLYGFRAFNEGRQRHYVYPFIMLLLCGVNGSFLTGDLFNLFVCFEVMLVASYVLISLGGERLQLREAIKYVAVNMLSSTLFFVAIAYMYSITGTLNMAHLSQRVAAAGQDGLMTTVGLLFLIVFGTKSALFLYFWLPGSYRVPPAPVAALFAALLTKVGIYTILRMFTLVFYHQPQITHTAMVWLAGATMVLGALGAVSHGHIRKILAYNIIVSVGFIVFGIGVLHRTALAGALYYLMHDMIAKALVYIIGLALAGTAQLGEGNESSPFRPWLGWLFFVTALAIAGVPPLSGFVGKLMILQGGVAQNYLVMAGVGLLTSLMVLYSLIKVFINGFWAEKPLGGGEAPTTGREALAPGVMLAALVIGLGLGADWVMDLVQQATEVMVDPSVYIEAVLGEGGGLQ